MGSRREARIGWHHAADQAHDRENDSGCNQRPWGDYQADVAGLAIFGEGAVKSQPADRQRDRVSQDDSQYASDESDGQGFRQELQQNVLALRAQAPFALQSRGYVA